MSATRKLRLGPLPRIESVKMTFACPASLKMDLDRYAALHAQTYGEAVDATLLIPHMLENRTGTPFGEGGLPTSAFAAEMDEAREDGGIPPFLGGATQIWENWQDLAIPFWTRQGRG